MEIEESVVLCRAGIHHPEHVRPLGRESEVAIFSSDQASGGALLADRLCAWPALYRGA